MTFISTERDRFYADILIGAVEGGTGYWAAVSGYHWSDEKPATTRATLHELNDEGTAFDGPAHDVTVETVRRGVNAVISGDVHVNAQLRNTIRDAAEELDGGEIDAEAADVIVQAGALGEVRYG